MTEREKPDLSSIEPIGRAPDADDEDPGNAQQPAAQREPQSEAKTSPETEAQLEDLRRS